jgi:hypothetical protein
LVTLIFQMANGAPDLTVGPFKDMAAAQDFLMSDWVDQLDYTVVQIA